jgi:hypothetical protein
LESFDPFPLLLGNMLKLLVKNFLAMGRWVHLFVLLKLTKLFPLDVLVFVSLVLLIPIMVMLFLREGFLFKISAAIF